MSFRSRLHNSAACAVLGLCGALVLGALHGCASAGGESSTSKPIGAEQLGLDAQQRSGQAPQQDAQTPQQPQPSQQRWWLAFGDAQLNQLIELAHADNPSLKIAAARVRQAQQYAIATRAINQPDLALNAQASRQRYSENYIYPPPFGGSINTDARVALDFNYEFDFWGRQRANLDAALRQIDVERADSAEAQLVLSIAVAQNYFALQRDMADLSLAQNLAQQRQTIADLVKLRVQRGIVSKSELEVPLATLANAQRQVSSAHQLIELDRDQLAALCGRSAATLPTLAAKASDDTLLTAPTALPADLLARRPDIAAQRLRVEVASKDIVAAKADFYPNINLTAFFGVQSLGTGDLFDSGSRTWGVGPALHLPLFNRDKLRAQLGDRYAAYDLAVEQYNRSVLDAVRETADAGATVIARDEQRRAADSALQALQRARDAAALRYRQGLSSNVEAINADIAWLEQQRAVLALRDEQLQARLALTKALGGGYDAAAPAQN